MLGAMEEGERLVPGRWAAMGVCSACRCLWRLACLSQAGPVQIEARWTVSWVNRLWSSAGGRLRQDEQVKLSAVLGEG